MYSLELETEWIEFEREYSESIYRGRVNIPSEPFCGVGALFNADLHTKGDEGAREEWEVLSPYEIVRIPVDEK